jgi:phosphonate ABC transporter permease subunit PhnE
VAAGGMGRTVVPEELRRPWYANWKAWIVAILIFGVYWYGWSLTDLDVAEAVRDLPNMGRVFQQLFAPNWILAVPEFMRPLLTSDPELLEEWRDLPDVTLEMIETVFLGVIATSIAILFAIPISFLGARNLMNVNPVTAVVYTLMRIFFTVVRSVDLLIVVILFAVAMGVGSAAGVFALAFHTIGVLGKLYAEAIENIDPGPIEAITATGANRVQVIWYAVVPQILNPFIALTIYRLDTNVRLAPIMGLVGGGGVGFLLIQYLNLLQYRNAAPILLEIILVVATMDLLSGQIRKRLE